MQANIPKMTETKPGKYIVRFTDAIMEAVFPSLHSKNLMKMKVSLANRPFPVEYLIVCGVE